MTYSNKKIAGSLLFIGGVQYVFGNAMGDHYGNNMVVNVAVVLLALLLIASAFFVQRGLKSTPMSILLLVTGISTLGVGFLTAGSNIYYVFAGIAYVFFALAAIWSFKLEKSPLNYFSIILGILAFIALALWAFGIDLGSGVKISALAVDSLMLPWLIGFSAHIIGTQE